MLSNPTAAEMPRAPRQRKGQGGVVAGAHALEGLEARVVLAVDPILPDNPLWAVPRGSAVIDGVLDDADWHSALTIVRTQATRDGSLVVVRMMWNSDAVFLSVDVRDPTIWADGIGNGAGNRWEVEQDDSITFYFDADNSREEFFQASDRALGVNLGNLADPINRSDGGVVRRWKYVKGDGAGGAPDVNPGGALAPGVFYASTIRGTANNNADVDDGWTIEMCLPWAAIGLGGPPVHGQTIGMNFDMIQDNEGGFRDLVDRRSGPERFDVPHFIDDHVLGVHSSYSATRAGVRGPVNYAEVMFIDPAAGERPAGVVMGAVTNVGPFGGTLNFAAPAGTTGGMGHVSGYEIRYSAAPIVTEGEWLDAAEFANAHVPRLRGLAEGVRITGLEPGRAYHVSVRAVDAAGNLSAISAGAVIATQALPAEGYRGRVVPSPMGRTLQYEDGTAFVPVGDHLGISWQYTRTLYPGLIWDNAHEQFVDFSDASHTAVEDMGEYLDLLQARGVNTMRTYLELENVHTAGNPGPLPVGTYWIENTPGIFNPAMRVFVLSLLQEAAARGIYVILSPFDTFSYDEAFGVEGPWAQNRGGPLGDINHFFQNPLGVVNSATLNLAKSRMRAVIDWVAESPHRDHVLGYEFLSEWDSFEWTLWPTDNGEAGRETEFRARAVYMQEMARFVRQEAGGAMVLNSTIARDPRGPLARLDFYSRNFDALTPHLYTVSSEEPINNPQADRKVMPAREVAQFTAYWMTHREDRAPIINGEWGLTRAAWPGGVPEYSTAFTRAEDEAIFRTVTWAGFASGQAGTGLRIATDELFFRGMILTDGMREVQATFGRFVNSASLAVDFGRFASGTLVGRVGVTSAAGKAVLAWGVSDGSQGVVYVLHDTNATSGTVTDGVLTIRGLRPDQVMDAEVWSTAAGATGPMAVRSGVFVGDGTYVITLPAFAEDVAVKFRARASGGQAQGLVSIAADGRLITFALGADRQPTAIVMENATGVVTRQDVASIARFSGRVVDMTPYAAADGSVNLALTDERHHLWIISGNPGTAAWTAVDMTAAIGAPGMTGDLTTYQPSWGAIHVAGVDARGHAINYWWAPGLERWQFSDLTALFNGPTLARGLAGYVAAWDGLNLAGLSEDGDVIVYWWAPGLSAWETVNMTAAFGGPKLAGQLDAYVLPWGGLNIAGLDAAGHVAVYWWAPGLDRWFVTDLTEFAGGPALVEGVEVGVSADGGINVFGLDAAGDLHGLRWTPASLAWVTMDVTAAAGGVRAEMPLASAASGNRLLLAGRGPTGDRTVILFSFFLDSGAWEAEGTGVPLLA